MDGDDDQRSTEIEILRSMYTEDELVFPDASDNYNFSLTIALDDQQLQCELHCVLPVGYPVMEPEISVRCDSISRQQVDLLRAAMCEELLALGDDELKVLAAVEWLKEHYEAYLGEVPPAAAEKSTESEIAIIKCGSGVASSRSTRTATPAVPTDSR